MSDIEAVSSEESQLSKNKRNPSPLERLADCTADALGVETCVINYTTASGRLFRCRSENATEIEEILKIISFQEDVEHGALLIEDVEQDQQVPDVSTDLVDCGVRFLANYPLRLQSGTLIGRIWLADPSPRRLPADAREKLASFARIASEMIYQAGRTARLFDAQEMASVGTWDWRSGTGLVFASSPFCAMFGVDRSRGGLPPSTLLRQIHKDDRRQFLHSLKEAFDKRRTSSFEFRIADRQDSPIHCIGTLRLDIDHLGKVAGAFGTCQDVTDRKRVDELSTRNQSLEDALQLANKLAEEQRNFVRIVSHEFRTPLAIIDGNANRIMRLMGKDGGAEQLGALVGRMRASVGRLIGVIESMLCISRIEAGRIVLTPAPVDMRSLLSEVCTKQQDITPDRQIDLEIDGITADIVGDGKLLRHVFTNLIANAVKYSPDGGLVSVRGWAEDAGIVIAVADTGIGVPADELPRLFERFFRASTATGIIGTGYGLNIVKQFVDLHGGMIEVTSVEGEGSTFTVTLPATAAMAAGAETQERTRLSA